MGTGKRVAWDDEDERDEVPVNRRVTKGGTTLSLFNPEDGTVPAYEIKCPKRPHGYAAQVWVKAREGYWESPHLFPTRSCARLAAKEIVRADLRPGASCDLAKWHKLRRKNDNEGTGYKWIRRVKGDAVQARYWLGVEGRSLNLGLFTREKHGEHAEWAAYRVSRAFGRLWTPSRTVGETVELLKVSRDRHERCPAELVVPECQRGLYPPRNYGAREDAEERAERLAIEREVREERRYSAGLLFAA